MTGPADADQSDLVVAVDRDPDLLGEDFHDPLQAAGLELAQIPGPRWRPAETGTLRRRDAALARPQAETAASLRLISTIWQKVRRCGFMAFAPRCRSRVAALSDLWPTAVLTIRGNFSLQ